MKVTIENHPCFNEDKKHTSGRVHLPVAPRCNVQCNFCNRKFDCANETRPGVTSSVLTPEEALAYLDNLLSIKKNISVVGIAGPGDPFANPVETMTTLRLVREKYPEMILCLATNGLALEPYIDELAELGVSHVTITVNGINPAVTSDIYSWIRYGKKVYSGLEAAGILLEEQIKSALKLKSRGIIVKINSIVIDGVIERHIPEIAKEFSALGADIMNCIPHFPVENTKFGHFKEPTKIQVKNVTLEAGKYLKIMHHCTRCRADAAGLLGENETIHDFKVEVPVKEKKIFELTEERPYIAVASREGLLINMHLGEVEQCAIYGLNNGKIELIEKRTTPDRGLGDERWKQLSALLSDCAVILVNGAGEKPVQVLKEQGLYVMQTDSLINEIVSSIFNGKDVSKMEKKFSGCGTLCSGTGGGCG